MQRFDLDRLLPNLERKTLVRIPLPEGTSLDSSNAKTNAGQRYHDGNAFSAGNSVEVPRLNGLFLMKLKAQGDL